jgi:hypothetical protein
MSSKIIDWYFVSLHNKIKIFFGILKVKKLFSHKSTQCEIYTAKLIWQDLLHVYIYFFFCTYAIYVVPQIMVDL